MPKSTKAIDISKLPATVRSYYDSLDDEGKARFFGFGQGARDDWEVPEYITTNVEEVMNNGNSFIVLGLDRPHNILSGYGGTKNMHCAAIDIVAGRLGFQARRKDDEGNVNYVDPNFKLDAARIYLSQKANVDSYFGLAKGTVGNTHELSPKSTVAIKADTLRFVARENIKLVTKTDRKNSQGGESSNSVQQVFGINLIAMNDSSDMQPLVKGNNLKACLREIMASVHELSGLFKNYLQYDRDLTTVLLGHTHYSPFFGIPTSPSVDQLVPRGAESLINKITNVETQLSLHMKKLISAQQNYIEAPGGAETVKGSGEQARSLDILSKYNHTN
tara:strand:+ start:21124 stop:22119 length:996 start_codon:yes stop_codon:yes gene_type:complete